ncbi:MAG: hypothetical protein LBG60_04010, partial [Bifidobacteriaceae bacterium]|nr:hypothetical protein [Bifidobacteriaceae bacterium]
RRALAQVAGIDRCRRRRQPSGARQPGRWVRLGLRDGFGALVSGSEQAAERGLVDAAAVGGGPATPR